MRKINGIWVEKPSISVVDVLENNLEYHDGMVKFAAEYCSSYRRALDIGACHGLIALQLSELFDCVEAYEPYSTTYDCLVKNTGHIDNITLHNIGLSDKEEEKTLYYIDNDGRTTYAKPHINKVIRYRDTIRKEKTKVNTLDSYNFIDVDLIKIDVEAYEEFVIKGALKTIVACKPVIILEEKPNKESTIYCQKVMDTIGYAAVKSFRDKDTVYVHRSSSN